MQLLTDKMTIHQSTLLSVLGPGQCLGAMDHSSAPVTHSVSWVGWGGIWEVGAHIPRVLANAKTPIRFTKDDLVMDHIASTHALQRSPLNRQKWVCSVYLAKKKAKMGFHLHLD